jgi:pilus assembly protein CpaD
MPNAKRQDEAGMMRVLALACLGLPLAACGADRAVTGSLYPTDYRQRHQIVLADAPRTLDVFMAGKDGSVDPRQREDIIGFAREYKTSGKGSMTALVPTGPKYDAMAAHTLDNVRRALGQGGLGGGYLSVATYRPDDPTVTAPIRLSFTKFQAKVASQCGTWPDDLGISSGPETWKNRPYWNFGCATQSNVASQIADPVDLVRARPEGRIDTLKRLKAIDSIRQGKDPSTKYDSEAAKTSSAVGSGG